MGDFSGSSSLKFVSKGEQTNDEEGRLMEFFIPSDEWAGSKPGCVSWGRSIAAMVLARRPQGRRMGEIICAS